jgi:hypothetical protein
VVIYRPPEEVFAFVADLDNWVWSASEDGERTYHTPVDIGDTFRQAFEAQGQPVELRGEVTGSKPGKSLSFGYIWEGSSLELSFIFEPVDDGTRLTGRGLGYASGMYLMFEPFINLEVNREIESNLNNLKSLMESESPDDS